MSDAILHLTPTIYTYLVNSSVREPEILSALRKETKKLSNAGMQISPEEGQFLGLLIRLSNAKKTLDIGTFTGYSALSVALALPDDGKVIACDTNAEWTSIAKSFWKLAKVDHKIDLKLAPATETLDNLIIDGQANTFDFAFIDADKQNYDTYYEKSLLLIKPGGLIAIDNVLWDGKVADTTISDPSTNSIRNLNAKILNDKRVFISMLPIRDGLTLALKL